MSECSRHCAEWGIMIAPIHRWTNWGWRKWSSLAASTRFIMRAGAEIQAPGFPISGPLLWTPVWESGPKKFWYIDSHLETVVSEDIYQTSVVPCRHVCADSFRFCCGHSSSARFLPPLSLSLPSFLFILPPASLPPFRQQWGYTCGFSHAQLCVTPWTVALQAPLSVGFSGQEHWSGFPCPPPGHLPDPGVQPASLRSPALAGGFFTTSTTWETR